MTASIRFVIKVWLILFVELLIWEAGICDIMPYEISLAMCKFSKHILQDIEREGEKWR